MRNLTIEEQLLAQIDEGWVNVMYDRTMEKARLGTFRHTRRALATYHKCYVGDMRANIGLSRDYKNPWSDSSCVDCMKIATRMGNWISTRGDRQYYLSVIRRFLEHLTLDHHWIPKTTA